MSKTNDVLVKEGEAGAEYTLKAGEESVWITVNNISVHIKRGDEGVSVCLYPVDKEDSEALVETYATYAEAEGDDEDKAEEQRRDESKK